MALSRMAVGRIRRRVGTATRAATLVASLLGAMGCDKATQRALRDPLPPRATERFCLVGVDLADPDATMPSSLTTSGCYDDILMGTVSADLIPYGVNAELWTDGAAKDRWFALPPDATLTLPDEGPWEFPVGSVIMKNFSFTQVADAEADEVERPVETRFMVRAESGWAFYSYAWNTEGTDATLLDDAMVVPLTVRLDGEAKAVQYQFPDRMSCATCHGDAPGRVLGPRTRQLNGKYNYDGVRANQLEALAGIGVFEGELERAADEYPSEPDPTNEKAPLEARARAYLDTHCASCHQPGGWTASDIDMDMRYETPFGDTRLCGVRSLYPYPSGTGRHRIAPGDPADSNLLGRLRVEGVGEIGEMPPLGRSILDPEGTALLERWIASLRDCPPPTE